MHEQKQVRDFIADRVLENKTTLVALQGLALIDLFGSILRQVAV